MKKEKSSAKNETSSRSNNGNSNKGRKQNTGRRGRKKGSVAGVGSLGERVSDFYSDNKKVINIAGIVAVTGLAVYAIAKWVPTNDILGKIEDLYQEHFGDENEDAFGSEFDNDDDDAISSTEYNRNNYKEELV